MKLRKFLTCAIIAAIALLISTDGFCQFGNFKQIRLFTNNQGDSSAIAANNGRIWYDFTTHEFRVTRDGANYSLNTGADANGIYDRVYQKKITVTETQIRNANTTRVELIPAPGANKQIVIDRYYVVVDATGAAYGTNTTYDLRYGGTSISADEDVTSSILTTTSDLLWSVEGPQGNIQLANNQNVSFFVETGNPTCASACPNLVFTLTYRIVNIPNP